MKFHQRTEFAWQNQARNVKQIHVSLYNTNEYWILEYQARKNVLNAWTDDET